MKKSELEFEHEVTIKYNYLRKTESLLNSILKIPEDPFMQEVKESPQRRWLREDHGYCNRDRITGGA